MDKDTINENQSNDRHRIIAVTPAGRKRYLAILSQYILNDSSIDEWHLWDNCRSVSDMDYIEGLSNQHDKIKIIKDDRADGTIQSVNRFYKYTVNEDCFYIKIDDDIVWLPNNFGERLYLSALQEKDDYLWWSPTVINNAICSYWMKAKGLLKTSNRLTAQANCKIGWGSAYFCRGLHREFIKLLKTGQEDKLTSNETYTLNLARFSINCIGYFGETCQKADLLFCPPDVDDEEWISATLPILLKMPGRLIGDITVSHFAYYTQERVLLKSEILNDYASLAGIECYEIDHKHITKLFFRHMRIIICYIALYLSKEVMELESTKRSDVKLRILA